MYSIPRISLAQAQGSGSFVINYGDAIQELQNSGALAGPIHERCLVQTKAQNVEKSASDDFSSTDYSDESDGDEEKENDFEKFAEHLALRDAQNTSTQRGRWASIINKYERDAAAHPTLEGVFDHIDEDELQEELLDEGSEEEEGSEMDSEMGDVNESILSDAQGGIKKKSRSRRTNIFEYDLNDPFVDDSELLEEFEVVKATARREQSMRQSKNLVGPNVGDADIPVAGQAQYFRSIFPSELPLLSDASVSRSVQTPAAGPSEEEDAAQHCYSRLHANEQAFSTFDFQSALVLTENFMDASIRVHDTQDLTVAPSFELLQHLFRSDPRWKASASSAAAGTHPLSNATSFTSFTAYPQPKPLIPPCAPTSEQHLVTYSPALEHDASVAAKSAISSVQTSAITTRRSRGFLDTSTDMVPASSTTASATISTTASTTNTTNVGLLDMPPVGASDLEAWRQQLSEKGVQSKAEAMRKRARDSAQQQRAAERKKEMQREETSERKREYIDLHIDKPYTISEATETCFSDFEQKVKAYYRTLREKEKVEQQEEELKLQEAEERAVQEETDAEQARLQKMLKMKRTTTQALEASAGANVPEAIEENADAMDVVAEVASDTVSTNRPKGKKGKKGKKIGHVASAAADGQGANEEQDNNEEGEEEAEEVVDELPDYLFLPLPPTYTLPDSIQRLVKTFNIDSSMFQLPHWPFPINLRSHDFQNFVRLYSFTREVHPLFTPRSLYAIASSGTIPAYHYHRTRFPPQFRPDSSAFPHCYEVTHLVPLDNQIRDQNKSRHPAPYLARLMKLRGFSASPQGIKTQLRRAVMAATACEALAKMDMAIAKYVYGTVFEQVGTDTEYVLISAFDKAEQQKLEKEGKSIDTKAEKEKEEILYGCTSVKAMKLAAMVLERFTKSQHNLLLSQWKRKRTSELAQCNRRATKVAAAAEKRRQEEEQLAQAHAQATAVAAAQAAQFPVMTEATEAIETNMTTVYPSLQLQPVSHAAQASLESQCAQVSVSSSGSEAGVLDLSTSNVPSPLATPRVIQPPISSDTLVTVGFDEVSPMGDVHNHASVQCIAPYSTQLSSESFVAQSATHGIIASDQQLSNSPTAQLTRSSSELASAPVDVAVVDVEANTSSLPNLSAVSAVPTDPNTNPNTNPNTSIYTPTDTNAPSSTVAVFGSEESANADAQDLETTIADSQGHKYNTRRVIKQPTRYREEIEAVATATTTRSSQTRARITDTTHVTDATAAIPAATAGGGAAAASGGGVVGPEATRSGTTTSTPELPNMPSDEEQKEAFSVFSVEALRSVEAWALKQIASGCEWAAAVLYLLNATPDTFEELIHALEMYLLVHPLPSAPAYAVNPEGKVGLHVPLPPNATPPPGTEVVRESNGNSQVFVPIEHEATLRIQPEHYVSPMWSLHLGLKRTVQQGWLSWKKKERLQMCHLYAAVEQWVEAENQWRNAHKQIRLRYTTGMPQGYEATSSRWSIEPLPEGPIYAPKGTSSAATATTGVLASGADAEKDDTAAAVSDTEVDTSAAAENGNAAGAVEGTGTTALEDKKDAKKEQSSNASRERTLEVFLTLLEEIYSPWPYAVSRSWLEALFLREYEALEKEKERILHASGGTAEVTGAADVPANTPIGCREHGGAVHEEDEGEDAHMAVPGFTGNSPAAEDMNGFAMTQEYPTYKPSAPTAKGKSVAAGSKTTGKAVGSAGAASDAFVAAASAANSAGAGSSTAAALGTPAKGKAAKPATTAAVQTSVTPKVQRKKPPKVEPPSGLLGFASSLETAAACFHPPPDRFPIFQ